MVVIKVTYGPDLRRLTFEDGLNWQEVSERLKKMFNLPLTYAGLNIFHVSEEGIIAPISNDKQFQEYVRNANDSNSKILRLTIRSFASETKVSEPIMLETKSSILKEEERTSILDRPDIRSQLQTIILETVQSKPFIDTIAQKLNLYIESTKNEIAETYPQSPVLETFPQLDLEELDALKRSLAEYDQVSLQVKEKEEEKQEEEEVEEKQAEQEEQSREEQKPKEEEQKPKEEEYKPKEEEYKPKEEEYKPKEQEFEQKDLANDVENSDLFVVLKPHEEKQEGLSISPLRSVLSFFKSFKKDQSKEVEEKTIPQEKLDEMNKQLNDMGFHDYEANMKALRFHYKYNEGLDAVIEDLLSQKTEQEELEESEEPLQVKSEDLKKSLIEKQEELEVVEVEEKEVQFEEPETQSEIPEGITEEDIRKLMLHANISKEAAIKALQSQHW